MKEYNALYLELTTECMLACPYCYHGERRNSNKFFPFERFCSLLDELPNKLTIDLSGGEPCLHPAIRSIIHLAAEKGHRVRLVTNGYLLPLFSINDLSLLETISISLDGTGPKDHDAIRGLGSFKRIEDGLVILKKAGLTSHVSFNITITRNNKNQLDKFIEYAIIKEVGSVNFECVHRIPDMKNTFIDHNALSIEEELSLYERTLKLEEEYKEVLHIIPTRNLLGECPLVKPSSLLGLRIDADMNVFPCEGFCGLSFSLGNIAKQSIEEVLISPQSNRVFEFLSNRIDRISECSNCVIKRSFCTGGCAADAYYVKRDSLCSDGACNARRLQVFQRLLNLENHREHIS